jgi:lipoyl(octanoyl) transferase
MTVHQPDRLCPPDAAGRPLRVYLLGEVDFEKALTLQRALAYEVSGERNSPALLLCEHPPQITVGRESGPWDLRLDPGETPERRWPVRWVNRGGGCLLHLGGQLAVYPVLALDRLGLGLQEYLDRLHRVLVAVLDDFSVQAVSRPGRAGLWVGRRMVAGVGVAVRDWVAYFGAYLNVDPDLAPFRLVHSGDRGDGPMTSLVRERRGPLRPALVRERLLEHFCAAFDCECSALFFNHPLLARPAPVEAVRSLQHEE